MQFRFFILSGISLALCTSSFARDYVSMKGSSTVFPFATIVAEQLGKNPSIKTPVVESGGSSVGKKGVCEGTGTQFVDIGNASSRMKKKELAFCQKNEVKVTEIKVGYDGIVVANSKKGTKLIISRADLAKALTAEVPNEAGTEFVPNYYKKWSDIKPLLPDVPIKVYGPPTTSGTRASFAEMINGKCPRSFNRMARARQGCTSPRVPTANKTTRIPRPFTFSRAVILSKRRWTTKRCWEDGGANFVRTNFDGF